MGIVLNGKKKLDSNDYQAIIIRKLEKGYIVNVQKKRNPSNTEQQTIKFSSSLKGLTDDKQIVEIIEYFLRNNKINRLEDYGLMHCYEGSFSLVKSNKSTLALQIPKNINNCDIAKKILDKYRSDRWEYLYQNSDVSKYEIYTSSYSSYSSYELTKKETEKEKHIKLNVNSLDTKFLEEFFKEKLNEIGEYASVDQDYVFSKDTGYVILGTYLSCGNLRIKLDKKNIPMTEKIVNEYNKELESYKEKQLKLEGF